MTVRPNDPAAELTGAPVRAENASDHVLGAASTGRIHGTAAHPDVAAFIAARAAATATPEPADELATDGQADPSPALDPAPHPGPAELPPRPDARPRIVEDPAILGLTRVSRSRLGSRLFTWFFVVVYALILIQLIMSLLQT